MFPEIPATPVAQDALAAYQSENEFMVLAVDLIREATSYVCIAACIMGQQPTWDRDQAIVGGHAVRLYKLLSAYLDQVCQRRRETADIFARLIFETAVNARYLVAEWGPSLADAYLRHSLRHERKLSDAIQSNIAARNGVILPIEDRMQKSINRSAQIAGIPLDSIDLRDKHPWGKKHLADKAKIVGWGDAYDSVFGGMSHNVHGSWQDLLGHQLEADGETFRPKIEWSCPRPQPLFALSHISLQVAADVSHHLGGEPVLDQLYPLIESLHNRVELADQAHEIYLSKKTWPMI